MTKEERQEYLEDLVAKGLALGLTQRQAEHFANYVYFTKWAQKMSSIYPDQNNQGKRVWLVAGYPDKTFDSYRRAKNFAKKKGVIDE